ncbi:40S ribosomal protein S2 [Microtus ochrogaster]|uniref:40S ribosomal protein S2 n=1 Tax=Microtus ochrogaster TaxID=79684 RepID=A0A8J6KPI3_MICOH|nr:40S ribosomal protein S2 [Microtus ochrogaster]
MADDPGTVGGPRGPGDPGRLSSGLVIVEVVTMVKAVGPMEEPEITDFFLGTSPKDEVLKILPVQKQTQAGQRTRFKTFVAIGDYNDYVGLGIKCSKDVATAIRGAIILVKLFIILMEKPLRKQDWQALPCSVQEARPLWLYVVLFPHPRHWHHFCLCPQEAAAAGQY